MFKSTCMQNWICFGIGVKKKWGGGGEQAGDNMIQTPNFVSSIS